MNTDTSTWKQESVAIRTDVTGSLNLRNKSYVASMMKAVQQSGTTYAVHSYMDGREWSLSALRRCNCSRFSLLGSVLPSGPAGIWVRVRVRKSGLGLGLGLGLDRDFEKRDPSRDSMLGLGLGLGLVRDRVEVRVRREAL